MTAKIIKLFDCADISVGDGYSVPAGDVLKEALECGLQSVVIIGLDADGDLFGAASHGVPDTLTLLLRGQTKLTRSFED